MARFSRNWVLRWMCIVALPAAACSAGLQSSPAGRAALPSLEPAVAAYLEAALDTLRRVSRHSDTITWSVLRDSTHALSLGARSPRDVYPVIDWLLERIDPHSFLQSNRFGVRDATLENATGYLRVPNWGSPQMTPQLSDSLQGMIERQVAGGACRWIVDLRMNGGGNMWPMLAGIGPLLGDTIVGGDVSPRGRTYWTYRGGVAALVHQDGRTEGFVAATAPVPPLDPERNPVAVLVDEGTGSSGEVIAIAFRGRPNTRHFGSSTAGASTTNQGFRLPDGVNMVITVGTYTDRSGVAYGTPLIPDEMVESPLRGPSMLLGDPVVAAAVRWLDRQSCL